MRDRTMSRIVGIDIRINRLTANSPIDTIDAPCSISTWIAITFVHVHLAVRPRRSRSTNTLVPVNTVFAPSSKLARVALALVDLRLAQLPGESWKAIAAEAVLSIDAGATVAGIRLAIVDVRLAGGAGESWWTVARVLGYRVLADSAVLAWRGGAVVYIDLTVRTSETVRTGAFEGVDQIGADAPI